MFEIPARAVFAMIATLAISTCSTTCASFESRDRDAAGESLRARQRELCEQANGECALGCGTPEYIDRRLGNDATRDYANTYTKCTAVCGERYQQCLRRVDQLDDRLSHAI